MSATIVVVIVLAVLVGLAWLFLVAVLRSHAEILRRLGAIERRLDPGGFALGDADGGERLPAPPTGTAPAAADIAGETLAGDAVKVALGPGSARTLLAFLSTGCSVCESLWAELRAGGPGSPDARIVVVTKGRERESLTRLGRLAPPGADLVMSSDAWSAYDVTATPHFVLVDSGTVTGRGGATSWTQILSLLADADSDVRLDRARTTSERAARAEQALAAAGIVPGHPTLYPSRDGEPTP
jgi:hypothetical protein